MASLATASTINAWSDSTVYQTLLPTSEPTATTNPWQCAIANLTQYFAVPKPTGTPSKPSNHAADKLIESSTATCTDQLYGCFPAKEEWCKFSAAATTSVLPDYSRHGSTASVWWTSHSPKAVELAVKCPNAWYNAMFGFPGGNVWLNETIIFAARHAERAAAVTVSASVASSTSMTATTPTLPGVSSQATDTVMPAPESEAIGRGNDVQLWFLISVGLLIGYSCKLDWELTG